MKPGFAWASFGAAAILAGVMSLAFFAAGGISIFAPAEDAIDRRQLEEIFAGPADCEACAALDSLTKRFARTEGALAKGMTRRLARWRLACAEEDLCSVPQMADLSGQAAPSCEAPGEEVDHLSVYGEINVLTRLITMRGEECGGMSCPITDCKDKAVVYGDLERLAGMLDERGRLADALPAKEDQDHAAMERMVRAFRRSARDQTSTIAMEFRKLSTLINDPPGETRGLADLEEWLKWRQRHIHRLADDIDFAAAETSLPYDALSEGLWRIRTLAIVLGNVTDAAHNIREIQREHIDLIGAPKAISREGRIEIYRAWQNLGDAVGETMLQMARITSVLDRLEKKPDWQLSVSTQAPQDPCTQLMRRQSKDAATKIRRAIAMLDFCGKRSGCVAGSNNHFAEGSDGAPALMDMSDTDLRGHVTKLRDRVLALAVQDSPPVDLSGEYASYRPGEAMTINARGPDNMCLAAGGSWIGIYRDGIARLAAGRNGGGPVRRRDLEAIVEHEAEASTNVEVMLEAPTAPGTYTVRIFSGPILGGTQIGEMPLVVEAPAHGGCDGFDGHWESKKSGKIWLSVRGNKVTGTYQRTRGAKPGIIVGRIRQNTLRGHWSTEFGSGGLALRLSDDGDSFVGTAGWARDQTTGAGDWEGYCVVSDSPS